MLRVVISNCSPAESEGLARALVDEGLAACVNVVPGVTSYYVWEGEGCQEQEHTLIIKTTTDRYEAMKARLVELHSYEVPEVIALDAVDALEAYATWVRGCVAGPQNREGEP